MRKFLLFCGAALLCASTTMVQAASSSSAALNPQLAAFGEKAKSGGCQFQRLERKMMLVICDTKQQFDQVQSSSSTAGLSFFGPTKEDGRLVFVVKSEG